jgi:hypothetical protein
MNPVTRLTSAHVIDTLSPGTIREGQIFDLVAGLRYVVRATREAGPHNVDHMRALVHATLDQLGASDLLHEYAQPCTGGALKPNALLRAANEVVTPILAELDAMKANGGRDAG